MSRVNLILHEFQVNVVGFDDLKYMYKDDSYLKEAYVSYENPTSIDRMPWIDYMRPKGLLFNEIRLCIPKCLIREILLKENHSGGLARNFGQDKTFA